jgi:hypothetical protein
MNTAESKIKAYIAKFYDIDQLESSLKLKADSISQGSVGDSLS